jgi:hypothetical protein
MTGSRIHRTRLIYMVFGLLAVAVCPPSPILSGTASASDAASSGAPGAASRRQVLRPFRSTATADAYRVKRPGSVSAIELRGYRLHKLSVGALRRISVTVCSL